MDAATKFYEFTGPCKYARVWEGQIDRKYETPEKGGKWGIIVNLAPEDVKLWNSLGTRGKPQRLADPEKNRDVGDLQLTRFEFNKFGPLGAPKVIGVEEGTSIGNGSIVTVRVEVYPFTYNGVPGRGARLDTVKVNELVPYEPTPKAEGSTTDGEPPVF